MSDLSITHATFTLEPLYPRRPRRSSAHGPTPR